MKHIVSSKKLKSQRRSLVYFIWIMVIVGFSMLIAALEKTNSFLLFILPISIIPPFMLMKELKRLNAVSYDERYLFFGKPEPNRQTPWENIRSITIGRFDHSVKVYLFDPVAEDRFFFFKPAVHYLPFVPMRNLEKIYELRDQIDRAKRSADESYEGETQILLLASFG